MRISDWSSDVCSSDLSKNRIPLLQSGQIDADIGTTTPTKTRDEVIDFSYVYVVDPTLILVRKGDSTDPADYFDSDRVVGALQGSFYVALWKQHAQIGRAHVCTPVTNAHLV